jgi:hypothetical protein
LVGKINEDDIMKGWSAPCIGEIRKTCRILGEKLHEKQTLGRP